MSRSRLQSLNSNIDHMKCSLSSKNSPRNTADFEAACSVYIRFRGVNGYAPREAIAEAFDLADVPELLPRYNIAPTQPVPVVRLDRASGEREIALLQWGLIPSWADDPAIGHRLINARAETVAEKTAFHTPFQKRRCLVVADGFYEWAEVNGAKQPHYFQLKDGSPFAFAGLWERWSKGEKPIESCTLLTTEANDVVSLVHDRMPIILRPPDLRDFDVGPSWAFRAHRRSSRRVADWCRDRGTRPR